GQEGKRAQGRTGDLRGGTEERGSGKPRGFRTWQHSGCLSKHGESAIPDGSAGAGVESSGGSRFQAEGSAVEGGHHFAGTGEWGGTGGSAGKVGSNVGVNRACRHRHENWNCRTGRATRGFPRATKELVTFRVATRLSEWRRNWCRQDPRKL